MHDLVHDLSLSLSSFTVVGETNDDISRIPRIKHLAFNQEQIKYCTFVSNKSFILIENNVTARTLQTLFFCGEVEKGISFQRFKCMRILKLSECRIEKLDDSVGELVHLRYLDFSYTGIRVLPDSIGKLYDLQTLKFQERYRREDLRFQYRESMKNLISLRYIKCNVCIPANILGQLTSLRKMKPPEFYVLREKGRQIEELSRLKHLKGKLCILNLENVGSKEDVVKANLSRKRNLNEITFRWNRSDEGANRNDKEVLEGLQPPVEVKILRILEFSGDNFPEWVMKMAIDIEGKWTPLDKLVSITLYACTSCRSLPTLEHLPHLRDLVLVDMHSLVCLAECDAVTGSTKPLSPSLRSFRLSGMKILEKWIDGAPNSLTMLFPVLDMLQIEDCPKIRILDECHPHPLVSLEIGDCKGLEYIKSVQGLTSLVSLKSELCNSLLGITDLLNQCHSLKTLVITDCSKLSSLPLKMFDYFASLSELILGPFSQELDSFPSLQSIDKLRNHLHSLHLGGWDKWESIPEIQHVTSLTKLTIRGFGIQQVPMWLTNMSSIRRMVFEESSKLDVEMVKRGAPQEASYVRLNKTILLNKM